MGRNGMGSERFRDTGKEWDCIHRRLDRLSSFLLSLCLFLSLLATALFFSFFFYWSLFCTRCCEVLSWSCIVAAVGIGGLRGEGSGGSRGSTIDADARRSFQKYSRIFYLREPQGSGHHWASSFDLTHALTYIRLDADVETALVKQPRQLAPTRAHFYIAI
ncbi:hypothetical protein VTK26DRAFT_1427 [Humicola hyalothermophila]